MWVSIAGLWALRNDIFDDMALPEGVDKETLIFNLFSETAELEILYPDPDFMKEMIKRWSRAEIKSWEKVYKTTVVEYDPIENYDRKEETEDAGNAVSRVAAFNEGELVTAGDGNTKATRKSRIHGNVGVTTTQQMLEEERRVASFTVYNYIIESFKKRFCLMVY